MRLSRAALAVTLVTAFAAPAVQANGRAPASSTIHFRAGHESDVIAGMTFGLVLSRDGGATWQWICEDAIGYGGVYDPVYVYTQGSAILATTFDGLRVSRDTCEFDPTPAGNEFASTLALGPDGTFFWGASNPSVGSAVGDTKIYRSQNDALSFDGGTLPPGSVSNDYWKSIAIAPSDPSRVYLSGYRFDATNAKLFLMFRSDDGGSNYTPLPFNGTAAGSGVGSGSGSAEAGDTFTTSPSSAIAIAAIDPTNPDIVYATVSQQDGLQLTGLYRSADAGAHWTFLYALSDRGFSFLLRGNGDLVIGTELAGVLVSHDRGAHWAALTGAPHVNCLAENAAGEMWACTQNYSVMGGPPTDDAGIMKTVDGVTWTTVLRFQDITQPVACGSATVQYTTCQVDSWCGLKQQLGITSTALTCALATDGMTLPVIDAPGGGGGGGHTGGCCDAGADAGGSAVLLTLGMAAFWWRRPRRGAHPRSSAC